MKVPSFVTIAIAATIVTVGCGQAPETQQATATPPPAPAAEAMQAMATLQPREGSTAGGTVTFTAIPGGVTIHAEVHGATPGKHGLHLHENGDCSAPDFSSAGGHFNPTGAPHGGPNAPEHHAGDLGNITVGEDGTGTLDLTSHMLTVKEGPASVLGKAVVLHAGEDDLASQPSGSSGERIACGVVEEVSMTSPEAMAEAGDGEASGGGQDENTGY